MLLDVTDGETRQGERRVGNDDCFRNRFGGKPPDAMISRMKSSLGGGAGSDMEEEEGVRGSGEFVEYLCSKILTISKGGSERHEFLT